MVETEVGARMLPPQLSLPPVSLAEASLSLRRERMNRHQSMGRTLLVGDGTSDWREWLQSHGERDLVCLDPADASHGPAARLVIWRGGRAVAWRFYGSLDPLRAPHVLVAAAAALLAEAAEDAIVMLPPLRPTPLARQLAFALADLVGPTSLLIPEGSKIDGAGWPVGPESVPRAPAFPEVVRHAQRKANWLKLLEDGEDHRVELARVSLQGARLGSGRPIVRTDLDALGLGAVQHAEIAGRTLLLVGEDDPEDGPLARAMDRHHVERVHSVRPSAYEGLLCAMEREGGQPLGMGRVTSISFATGVAHVRCTAVAPAPVRTLRLGALRIDADGNELGEVRPWQV